LSHSVSPCSAHFGDGVPRSTYLGWPQTEILLILASQVTRITAVSHQHLARYLLYVSLFL
jgi:hypothetical protein